MPEIDERAMAFVVETLKKNPSIELEELFQRTKKVSSSMAELSKRQFNARYPLQVKRRRALAVRAKDTGRKKPVQPKGRPSKKPRSIPRTVCASADSGSRESAFSVKGTA